MIFRLFLILIFIIPIQFSLGSLGGFDFPLIRILSLAIFLWWATDSFFKKRLSLPLTALSFFVISFLLLSIFSMFFAENSLWAFRKIAFLFNFLPFFIIPYSLIKKQSQVYKVLTFVTLGSFFTAIIGVFQFSLQFLLGLDNSVAFWGKYIAPFFLGENFSLAVIQYSSWLVNISGKTIFRTISIFPDPHMLSFYLGMTAPLALFLFIKSRHNFHLYSFVVILLANFLTFSRGGYIAIMASLILGFFIFRKKLLALINTYPIHAIGILFVLIFFLMSPPGERFFSSFDLNEGSNQGRIEIWKKSFETYKNNPMGVGLANFPLKVNPLAGYRNPIYSHNLYLDILVEVGFLGLFFFVGSLLFSIFNSLKKAKNDSFYFAILLSIIIFSVHSFFETPVFSVHILPLLFVLMSISDLKLKNENI